MYIQALTLVSIKFDPVVGSTDVAYKAVTTTMTR